jgi:hypothetical protein
VTLYQMATGLLPVWHDGKTDPTMVESEATIATEQFVDPNLRQQLTEFFRRALRRNPRERFDNAEKMLEAWQKVFSTVSGTLTITTEGHETDNSALLAAATIDTNIAELGLGPAAVDALDRINVVTVRDLLRVWGRKLARMRGVGNKTRKRILAAVKSLRERLGDSSPNEPSSTSTDEGLAYDGAIPQEQLSIDMLAGRILRAKAKSRNATETTALEALLGLDDRVHLVWPSQGDIAPLAGVTRGRISQILAEAQSRWLKDPAITAVRDEIAKEDPFVPPARVVEILREIPVPPEAEPLSDARLIRLAAAASQVAAISSKQEIYPRNMEAGRALKLSHGSLVGVRFLTADQIRQRVSSRYPLAARLPGRPQLDKLIADAGLELKWNADHPRGGIYVSTARNVLSVSDVTSTGPRYSTSQRATSGAPTPEFLPAYVPQEIAEARAFEERLRYAEKNGSFLALTVKMSLYDRARKELTTRFATRAVDLEREFLAALRQGAQEVGADWSVVLHADASDRRSEDWRNLNHLIASNVIPRVEKSLIPGDRTILAFHLNWLERYGQMVLLSRVAQAVQDGRLHGAWLLIPASPQTPMPLLDGAAVPVITNNQWAHIPESWCQNVHRSSVLNSTYVTPVTPVASVEHKQASND